MIGTWELTQLRTPDGATIPLPPKVSTPITAIFRGDGTLAVRQACNSMIGDFEVTGTTISFPDPAVPAAYCVPSDLTDAEREAWKNFDEAITAAWPATVSATITSDTLETTGNGYSTRYERRVTSEN